MSTLLALLLLAELPGVALSDHGKAERQVRHLNCTGAGVTCSTSSTFGTIDVAGAPTLAIPTCSAGQATTANGSSFSCVSTISTATSATSAATATALAANPTDCAANRYATTIDASGNLTCAQVTTAQLSGTVTNAQLASSYSGVGACGSHAWASTLSANAAPTCTQPAFSDVSGSLSSAQLGTVTRTGSNVTNNSVTPATTGLSWAIAANQTMGFYCVVSAAGTATSLPRFNISGPTGGAAGTTFAFRRFTAAGAETFVAAQGFNAAAQTAACTSSCTAATVLPNYFHGTIINGATPGTVDVQFSSSTSLQTVTVYQGSYCEFR